MSMRWIVTFRIFGNDVISELLDIDSYFEVKFQVAEIMIDNLGLGYRINGWSHDCNIFHANIVNDKNELEGYLLMQQIPSIAM